MSDYYDISKKCVEDHPYQNFFLAIKRDRYWNMPSSYSQQEIAMLSLLPNSNEVCAIPSIIFAIVVIILSWISYFYVFSFDTLLILLCGLCGCHLVYMYYFTHLPAVRTEKRKFLVSRWLCILGLFITLVLVNYNYENREAYNHFVKENNFEGRYSEEALREVFLKIKISDSHRRDRQKKLEQEVNELVKTLAVKECFHNKPLEKPKPVVTMTKENSNTFYVTEGGWLICEKHKDPNCAICTYKP